MERHMRVVEDVRREIEIRPQPDLEQAADTRGVVAGHAGDIGGKLSGGTFIVKFSV